jgi:outer membrane protein
MKNILLILSILTATAFTGYAQQPQPDGQVYNFTLADCINYAYEHRDSVLNAGLDVKSAEYRVKETIGRGLPQVNATGSFQDYLKIATSLLPAEVFGGPAGTFIPVRFGVKYQSSLGANLSQIIFDGDYLVGLQSRGTYKHLFELNYTRSKIDANVTVTKVYYQVLVNGEQIKLLDANIVQLKQLVDQTTAQNKQGFVEKIDVDRLMVQYNDLVTTRENTISLLALNYQLLKFQMGMPIENNIVLKDKLQDVKLENIAEVRTDSTFYLNRIEYSLLETQKKLSEFDLKSRKAGYLPKLTFNANFANSYQNNSFGNLYSAAYPVSYIGLTLNVPIFSGFQRSNQVKQAEITVRKAENNMFQLKNALSLQASQAKTTYINGLRSLNNQKANQALAQEVLRVTRIKYQQGVGSSIEVTQAQTTLQDADNRYIQGLYQALVSKVDLDKAYGIIK